MIVVCERCHKKQENRTADIEDKTKFYLGCVHCGHPYGFYAREGSR